MSAFQDFPAVYATLYPMLARVAREHGYAAALHGSMGRDLDVLCAPWTEGASAPEELAEALYDRVGHLVEVQGKEAEEKPHGRIAWDIPLSGGAYIDLSIMPIQREAAT